MEYENKYASNGKGNLGVTLGAIGAGAALLNGGLGGILGNWGNNNCCPNNQPVNRYDAEKDARIAQLETDKKFLESNIYTDQKSLELYKYIDGELREIRGTLSAQAVHNQKSADAFEMVRNDMICCKNELYAAIARERDDRCCADNAIVNYSNATFYPKQVADVTVGTTSTAQMVYNPLPNCSPCSCGR